MNEQANFLSERYTSLSIDFLRAIGGEHVSRVRDSAESVQYWFRERCRIGLMVDETLVRLDSFQPGYSKLFRHDFSDQLAGKARDYQCCVRLFLNAGPDYKGSRLQYLDIAAMEAKIQEEKAALKAERRRLRKQREECALEEETELIPIPDHSLDDLQVPVIRVVIEEISPIQALAELPYFQVMIDNPTLEHEDIDELVEQSDSRFERLEVDKHCFIDIAVDNSVTVFESTEELNAIPLEDLKTDFGQNHGLQKLLLEKEITHLGGMKDSGENFFSGNVSFDLDYIDIGCCRVGFVLMWDTIPFEGSAYQEFRLDLIDIPNCRVVEVIGSGRVLFGLEWKLGERVAERQCYINFPNTFLYEAQDFRYMIAEFLEDPFVVGFDLFDKLSLFTSAFVLVRIFYFLYFRNKSTRLRSWRRFLFDRRADYLRMRVKWFDLENVILGFVIDGISDYYDIRDISIEGECIM